MTAECPLKETVGGSSWAWTSHLVTPEASKLRGLDGITWHREFEHVKARHDGRRQTEDLVALFENLSVECFYLLGSRWSHLAGIRESRVEGMLKVIYFAINGGRSVADGVDIALVGSGGDHIMIGLWGQDLTDCLGT